MQLDEQDERSRKNDIDDRSVTNGKVTEATRKTILEKKAMNTEPNRTDDSELLGFASWVPICLIVSLAVNFVQGVNLIWATSQHSVPGPRNLNQNIVNNYYVYTFDSKNVADDRVTGETDSHFETSEQQTIAK